MLWPYQPWYFSLVCCKHKLYIQSWQECVCAGECVSTNAHRQDALPGWAPAASLGCGSVQLPAASPPQRWRQRSPRRRRGEGCPLHPAPRAWGGETGDAERKRRGISACAGKATRVEVRGQRLSQLLLTSSCVNCRLSTWFSQISYTITKQHWS